MDHTADKAEFWYKAAVGEPIHARVVPYGKALQALYRPAHSLDRSHERIYDNPRLRQYGQALRALDRAGINAARLNVVKSVVNTVVSRLSKDRPMPSFVVDDADWSLKRKAKRYRKFILGEMNATGFDDCSREALRDGSIIGTGLTRIDDSGDGEKVFAERMLREEYMFDPREAKYGKPQQAMHVHRIAKAYLAELYPDSASEIWGAMPSQTRPQDDQEDNELTQVQNLADYIDVYEAWHLPYCTDGDDGRHALCIDGKTLLSEKWEEPRFPVAMFRYAKPLRGTWGRGLVQDLADLQHRVNCIVRDMQMNIQATSRGYYAVQEGMDIPVEQMTGWQPFKLKYKGSQAPVWTTPQSFNPAQMQALEMFIQKMYDLPGVSQAGATSKSALGAGASGAALDTQYDIDSERFAMEQAQYAAYRMEAAQLYLDAAKRVAKKRKSGEGRRKYVTTWNSGDSIERLEYDKVSLKSDQYRLQLEPVNFIPDTKAGKLSVVGQLTQAGVIPQWLSAALFDEPDLARANKINLAAFHNCERKMEELADADKPAPVPETYNDIDLELKMSVAYYNNAQAEYAPEEVCDRFRTYIELVKDQKKKSMPPPAPPMPGGMPGAAPGGPTMPGMAPALPPAMPPGAAMPMPQ